MEQKPDMMIHHGGCNKGGNVQERPISGLNINIFTDNQATKSDIETGTVRKLIGKES